MTPKREGLKSANEHCHECAPWRSHEALAAAIVLVLGLGNAKGNSETSGIADSTDPTNFEDLSQISKLLSALVVSSRSTEELLVGARNL